MKLTQKKKMQLHEIINRYSIYLLARQSINNKGMDHTLKLITECVEASGERSLPEHKMYWSFCTFASKHVPEIILCALDVSACNSDMIHNLFKAKYKKESTSFSKMNESEFNEYFNKCQDWFASYFLRITKDEMLQQFERGEV